jgi:hypothetical protein
MTWISPDWDDLRRYLGLGFCGDLEAAESRFVGSGKYRRLYRWGGVFAHLCGLKSWLRVSRRRLEN